MIDKIEKVWVKYIDNVIGFAPKWLIPTTPTYDHKEKIFYHVPVFNSKEDCERFWK